MTKDSFGFPPYDAAKEPLPLPERLRQTGAQGRQEPHVGDPADWNEQGDGRTTAPAPPRNTAPTRPPPLVVGGDQNSSFVEVSIDLPRDIFEPAWQLPGVLTLPSREISAHHFALPAINMGVVTSVGAMIVYACVVVEGAFASIVGALTPQSYWDQILSPQQPMS